MFKPRDEVRPRGPDRKPRQLNRLIWARALAAAQQRNGQMVRGAMVENLVLRLQELCRDKRPKNRPYILAAMRQLKETFDDAPDSGSGRTTMFIFASEVEAEMKKRGKLPSQPEASPQGDPAPGPLAGMEEVEPPSSLT